MAVCRLKPQETLWFKYYEVVGNVFPRTQCTGWNVLPLLRARDNGPILLLTYCGQSLVGDFELDMSHCRMIERAQTCQTPYTIVRLVQMTMAVV